MRMCVLSNLAILITYGVIFDTLFLNRVEFEEKYLEFFKSSDFLLPICDKFENLRAKSF